VARLKRLVDEGALGRLLQVHAYVPWYRPPEYYSGSRWRGTWALDGGGALMNQGIHTVDLLLWLAGDVRRVQAAAGTALHRIEVEDTAAALLDFASGALGVIAVTTAAYPGYERRIQVTGSEGSAVLLGDRLANVDVRGEVGADGGAAPPPARTASAASPVVADAGPHRAVFEDFLEAMATGRAPRCDGGEARRSLALVHAIYDAARWPAGATRPPA
jgi:predicted dehydrogenase